MPHHVADLDGEVFGAFWIRTKQLYQLSSTMQIGGVAGTVRTPIISAQTTSGDSESQQSLSTAFTCYLGYAVFFIIKIPHLTITTNQVSNDYMTIIFISQRETKHL
ncbi:hypothetical protein ACJX0J_032827, partial [Zea mays]